MKRLGWSFSTISLLILLLPSYVAAQRGGTPKPFNNPVIQVQVRNSDNTPAPRGVLIELEGEDGTPIDQQQTDSSGKCRFIPPSPAVYIVRAKQPGYQPATSRLDLQNTQTGMAFLVLKPIPGQTPPTPSKDASGSTVSAIDLSVPAASRKEYDLGQHALEGHDVDGGVAHLKKAIE